MAFIPGGDQVICQRASDLTLSKIKWSEGDPARIYDLPGSEILIKSWKRKWTGSEQSDHVLIRLIQGSDRFFDIFQLSTLYMNRTRDMLLYIRIVRYSASVSFQSRGLCGIEKICWLTSSPRFLMLTPSQEVLYLALAQKEGVITVLVTAWKLGRGL